MQDQLTATKALEILITHPGDFTRVAANIVGPHDANDVYQATAASLLRRASKGKTWTAENPYAYVHRIVVRTALEHLRSSQNRLFRMAEDINDFSDAADPHASPSDATEVSESAARARRAIDCLPEHHRAAWLLYADDAPYAEIAEAVGAPATTVRSWLHRGRASLIAAITD